MKTSIWLCFGILFWREKLIENSPRWKSRNLGQPMNDILCPINPIKWWNQSSFCIGFTIKWLIRRKKAFFGKLASSFRCKNLCSMLNQKVVQPKWPDFVTLVLCVKPPTRVNSQNLVVCLSATPRATSAAGLCHLASKNFDPAWNCYFRNFAVRKRTEFGDDRTNLGRRWSSPTPRWRI